MPRGGTLVVAMANPIAATEPGTYETNEEHEVLANVFETLVTTDSAGQPRAARSASDGLSRTTLARCAFTCVPESSFRTALP